MNDLKQLFETKLAEHNKLAESIARAQQELLQLKGELRLLQKMLVAKDEAAKK